MNKYSYNHQEQKRSGVQLPAMIAQKNNQKYKLLSAEDIAWNVRLNKGTTKEVSIEDTDDLLDYISEIQNYVEDVTDDVVQKVFSTYKIECDVSVCYAGETFDHSPVINVYKTINGQYTQTSYQDVIEDGIVPVLESTSSNNIIQYNETEQCLNGTAVAGINTLKLLRQEDVVASYQITILNRPERVFATVIYTESETQPETPIGGSCDGDLNFTPPTGWVTDASILNESATIWFSIGTVFLNNNSATWSDPCMYITKKDIQKQNKHISKGVAIYKTLPTNILVENNGRWILSPNTETPETPDAADGYDFSTNKFTAPTGWQDSPQLSIEAYVESIESLIESEDDVTKKQLYDKTKNSYKTYVSYNNYTASFDGNFYFDIGSTGWTTPIEYLNIDSILEQARDGINKSVDDAVNDATADLKDAQDNIIKQLEDTGNTITNIQDLVEQLKNSVSDFVVIDTIVDSLNKLYTWEKVDPPVDGSYVFTTVTGHTYNELVNDKKYTGADWYDKYVYLTQEEQHYRYTATSVSLLNQLSALDARVGTLKTAVDEKTPDWIRLQVSKGYLDDVTWTRMGTVPTETDSSKVHENLEDLPKTGYVYGDYYILKDGTIYRCDYPISTGFLKILADKLTLGVAKTEGGQTNSATIQLGIDDNGSTINMNAGTITLDGDVIADAIATKDLNINNTTYLKGDGQVLLGQETDGASGFNTDGTGYIAGGRINWNNPDDNFELTVTGTINALSGQIGEGDHPWYIGAVNDIPAIYADDQDGYKLLLTTQYLEGGKTDDPSWRILKDGTATFAKGNVVFNNDGSGYIGVPVVDKDTQEPTGEIDGIVINSNGNVSVAGKNVTIGSDTTTQIGSKLLDDDNFGVVLINEYGTNILGNLNTEDISVGSGSCFFKGSDKANESFGYEGGTKGSGHLANKNIKWDSNGDLTVTGDIKAKTLTVMDPITGADCITFETTPEGGFTTPSGVQINLPKGCPVMVIHYEGRMFITNLLEIGNGSNYEGATAKYYDYYENMYVKPIYNTWNPLYEGHLAYDESGQGYTWNMSNKTQKRLWLGNDGLLYTRFSTKDGIDLTSAYNGYLYTCEEKDIPFVDTETTYGNYILKSRTYNTYTYVIYAHKYENGALTDNKSDIESMEKALPINKRSNNTVRKHEYGNGHFAIENVSYEDKPGVYVYSKIKHPNSDRHIEITIDNNQDPSIAGEYTYDQIDQEFKDYCNRIYGKQLGIDEFCDVFIDIVIYGNEDRYPSNLRTRIRQIVDVTESRPSGEEEYYTGGSLLDNGNSNSLSNELRVNDKLSKIDFSFKNSFYGIGIRNGVSESIQYHKNGYDRD